MAETVEIVRHHPPAIEPASPEASSNTYRLHVPFADAPLNVANSVAPLGVGAPVNGSLGFTVGSSTSVGRYVPVTGGFATGLAASSSKPRSTPEIGVALGPPTSLSSTMLVAGFGPASSTSRSWDSACVMPLSWAVTFVTFDVLPDTVMCEGYG